MSKTWLSVMVAAGLMAASVAIFAARRSALGLESSGPPGWKVSLVIEGTLLTKEASISVHRPLHFRRQHISEERFDGGKELREPLTSKRAGQRRVTWRRQAGSDKPVPFRLEYSFLCSWRRQTPAMERVTVQVDAEPNRRTFLKSTPRIQAKDQRIVQIAKEKAADGWATRRQARALFDFVSGLGNDSSPEAQTALGCLQKRGGDTLGKARLLVACCRSRGIQARLLSGVPVRGRSPQPLHHWVEAWIEEEWLPMDPAGGHFGQDSFPENYLVFALKDLQVVISRGANTQPTFLVAGREAGISNDVLPSRVRDFWRKLSFHSLHISEQRLVEFLLLLPLAALIVSVARTIIGVKTFGIFAPALIGLAFLDLEALPWGLLILVLTILIGWGMRHGLERFHLLQVPRVSAMLTLIVILLLVVIVTASNYGITTTRFVSLFPLIIVTFLVERFWTIEAEDSTAASFQTLLGTIAVAVAVSLALSPHAVRTWMFRYPETLGSVLALLLLLGRYTGYRLTELYRFQELIQEPAVPEDRS